MATRDKVLLNAGCLTCGRMWQVVRVLPESQPAGGVARWALDSEEIEKLGSDPIIMTPANPSRSHLLEMLGTQILSLIPKSPVMFYLVVLRA